MRIKSNKFQQKPKQSLNDNIVSINYTTLCIVRYIAKIGKGKSGVQCVQSPYIRNACAAQ